MTLKFKLKASPGHKYIITVDTHHTTTHIYIHILKGLVSTVCVYFHTKVQCSTTQKRFLLIKASNYCTVTHTHSSFIYYCILEFL